MASVTPYEVSGSVDYDRLIKEFGVSRIEKSLYDKIKKHAGADHHLLRRNIFFAHRDMEKLISDYEKGKKFFLYTGRGPSGNTHIGHIIPWIFTKWLQDAFDVELYFQLTDDEKFMFRKDLTLEDTNRMARENALDLIALGFDPKKTHIIIDSEHSGLLYPEAIKVAKGITFSTAKSVFGFTNETNIGSIFFTSIQAVPAFLPSILKGEKMNCLIPHAIDQDPHFRVSRDIIPKLGYPKPASIQCRFIPGLGGMDDGKMSTSSGDSSTIYVNDDEKTVKNKINKYAFSGGGDTVEEHREKGGDTSIDIAYQWLTFFEEDDEELKRIHDASSSGQMLTGEIKTRLIEKLNAFLSEHRKKKEKAKDKLDDFLLKV